MQTLQLVPRITHITAHRRISPTRLTVTIEPHMQLHQTSHSLNRVIIKTQRTHTLLHHLRAHHLMVQERDGAVLLKLTSLRLTNIVHQRRKTQNKIRSRARAILVRLLLHRLLHHLQRMRIHILMVMRRIHLHTQRRKLRQHIIRQTRIHQQVQTHPRIIRLNQLHQLITHTLSRNNLNTASHLAHRLENLRGNLKIKTRSKTSRTHHTQRILRKRLLRRARSTQNTRTQILNAAKQVNNLTTGQSRRHRINREITTHQICAQIRTELNRRLTRIRNIHLSTVRGHLIHHAILTRTNRAVLLTDIPRMLTPPTQNLLALLRRSIRRQIKIGEMAAVIQQIVADNTAHQVQLKTRRTVQFSQLGGIRVLRHNINNQRHNPLIVPEKPPMRPPHTRNTPPKTAISPRTEAQKPQPIG